MEISGFDTGIHARGWSNGITMRNILFKQITDYGLWVTGCVDNSFADIRFENCLDATAIRIDNYVDKRAFEPISIGNTQFPTNNDHNQRLSLSVHDQLGIVFSEANDNMLTLVDLLDNNAL